jgi:hypothetical protein
MQSRAESGLSGAGKMLYPGELTLLSGSEKVNEGNKHSALISKPIENWVIAPLCDWSLPVLPSHGPIT